MSDQYFQVALRVRKLLANEDIVAWVAKNNTLQSINLSQVDLTQVDSKDRRRIMAVDQMETQKFCYDQIESDQKTQGMYTRLCRPLVKQSLQGYHSTILCYGQTTSGKTFTILGNPENPGVLPCALRDVLSSNLEIKVWIQYIQIYNEQLDDLLSDNQDKLTIIDDNQWGTQIQGAKKIKINTFQEAVQLLNEGENRRIYRATKIHDHSSRSHTMFKIYIENTTQTNVTFACLNLIDLAGSERLSDTDALSQTETGYINKSLFSLTNVINKLADKNKHIPFRDSKLTRLLKDSLGGNAFTLLICCISPAKKNFLQTLSTLKFANRAKLIKNAPQLQIVTEFLDPKDKVIQQLQDELQKCHEIISNLQKISSSQKIQQQTKLCSSQLISEFCLEVDPSLLIDENFRQLKQYEDQYDSEINNVNNIYLDQIKELSQYTTDKRVIQLIDYIALYMNDNQNVPQIHNIINQLKFPQQQSSLSKQLQELKLNVQSEINLKYVNFQREKVKNQGLCSLLNKNYNLNQNENFFDEQIQLFNKNIEQIISQVNNAGRSEFITKDQLLNTLQENSNRVNTAVKANFSENPKINNKSIQKITIDMQESSLYLWGSNQDGRLGVGNQVNIAKQPKLLRKFAQVSCGSHHTLALSQNGQVYVWGRGQKGQLGLGNLQNVFEPQLLDFKHESIVQVVCGWQHSVALDGVGKIYTWGYGDNGQLGHGDCSSQEQPKMIKSQTAQTIYAGYSNTAFLNSDDELYIFGSNWDGRCMLPELQLICTPQLVLKDKIRCLSLGVSHMGVVMSSGQLVMAGTGTQGQLGIQLEENAPQTIILEKLVEDLGGSDEQATYEKEYASSGIMVEKFSNGGCKQVACGDRFTLVLSDQGRVYSFGNHSYNQLGFLSKEDIFEPTLVMSDTNYISVGCKHAGAITKQNELFMWGFNFHNQLGMGNNDQDQVIPVKIDLPGKVIQISLGYFHSAALIQ